MAKDQNTYAKRAREMEKKRKAEAKRARRRERKEQANQLASDTDSDATTEDVENVATDNAEDEGTDQ